MYIIEQFFFTFIFSRRLQRRGRYGIKMLTSCAVFIFLSVAFQYMRSMEVSAVGVIPEIDSGSTGRIVSSFIFCGAIFVVMIGWIYLLYEVSPSEAAYAATLAYMSEHIAYCIRLLIGKYIIDYSNANIEWTVFFASLIIIGAAADVLFAGCMVHGEHYIARPQDTIVYLVAATFVVMTLSIFATALDFEHIHAIYAIYFCIFTLYAQVERQRSFVRQRESDIREQLLISQRAQYESYHEQVELVNRKCHDLKHQVGALRSMSTEAQDEALREIEDSVLIYDSYIKTGNDGLDVILTGKNHLCAERDILFTCVADGGCLSFMSAVDMFTLFGNLMDNAIEAVCGLPAEMRSISLSVTERAGVAIIREENPRGKLNIQGGNITTTKRDAQNHGYGLRSMELVAEKYDGSFSIDTGGDTFTVSIAIPIGI